MIFFLLLALFFMELGSKERKWFFLAGTAGILAYSSKGVCLYILLAFILGFLAHLIFDVEQESRWRSAAYFFSGFGLSSVLWFFLIYFPHSTMIKALSRINIPFLVPPRSLEKMLANFWTRPPILFENLPVISALSWIFFLILLFRIVHSPRSLSLLEWILAFWYGGGFAYLAIIEQRVTRHFIPLIIPLVFLSAFLLQHFWETGRFAKPKKPKVLFAPLLFGGLFFPLSQPLRWLLEILPPGLSKIWPATFLLCGICALSVGLFYLLVRFWPENFEFLPSLRSRKALVGFILLLATFFSGQNYLDWALNPQFKLKTISKDLDLALDRGAAIAGLWAPVICLENRHRAHESFPNYVNDQKDFLEKYGITHVFASSFFGQAELNYYRMFFQEAMEKARLLVKYPVWNGDVFLFRLPSAPDLRTDDLLLEAEVHTAPLGLPRYDPQASSLFSVQGLRKQKGYLVHAPLDSLPPRADYRIFCLMKTDPATLSLEARLARIDVVDPDARRVLAVKDILAGDIPPGNGYQEIPLPFYLDRSRRLEFRFYSDGSTDIWIDHIRVDLGTSQGLEK